MINLSDLFFEGVLDDQSFSTSGTWTRPAGVQLTADDLALIEMWGGGAGGTGGGPGAGIGGCGGAYRRIAIPALNLGETTPVIIGAGGFGFRDSGAGGYRIASAGGDTTILGISAYGGPLGKSDQSATSLMKLYASGRGGRSGSVPDPVNTGQLSLYGGKGGDGYHQFNTQAPVRAWDGSAPGGGGGGISGHADQPQAAGSGAAGGARIRLLRGIKEMQIWDFIELWDYLE